MSLETEHEHVSPTRSSVSLLLGHSLFWNTQPARLSKWTAAEPQVIQGRILSLRVDRPNVWPWDTKLRGPGVHVPGEDKLGTKDDRE